MKPLLAAISLTVLLLNGCGKDPTVDARGSDEQTRASIERVKDALPEDQRDDFEDALRALAFADVNDLTDLADPEGMIRRMEDRLHGKTGTEIIEEGLRIKEERDAEEKAREAIARERAERMQAEREQQRIATVSREIEALAAKLETPLSPLLKGFVIESAFLERGTGGMMDPDRIKIRFRNGTDQTITAARVRLVFHTPGRELPWTDTVAYTTFKGGLDPGETTDDSFTGGLYSDWSRLPRDRDDFAFSGIVVELAGTEGESLTGERLTDTERKQLEELLTEIEYEGEHDIRDRLVAMDESEALLLNDGMKEAAFRERDSLRSLKVANDAAQAQRDALEITDSRFYWEEQMFRHAAVFSFTVVNNTEQTVSRFKLDCVVSSPDRELPWAEGGLNYSPNGGLEPGESRDLELSPRRLSSDWDSVPKDREDLKLSVRVVAVADADDNEMFPSEWTESQKVRLETIEALIRNQKWE